MVVALPALVCSACTLYTGAAPPAHGLPWAPPAPESPQLLSHLRNTSRPKLSYSTYIGWYEDGGLNETALFAQVEAMATRLRPHGWDSILHDYGWQVCGSTYHVHDLPNGTLGSGCIHVDDYGRLFPSPLRYPSTRVNSSFGTWKPFIDRAHAQGIGFGLHLMQGIPKVAVQKKLPIMGSNFTADMIVRGRPPNCASFVPDHWAIDASHPGAQLYYDSVVSNWAEQGLDFVYFDGILDCGFCHIGTVSLISDSLRRLGNGMYLFTSWGPPSAAEGCSFEALSALAPYVRVGADTIDSFAGSVYEGFSEFTRSVAPSVRPHHFGDLASLMVGKVHCVIINGGHTHNNKVLCPPGPDYYIPSNRSHMTEDEVFSYASLIAIFRSTWWPSGVLTDMNDFEIKLLTNDAVLRVSMMGQDPREVVASAGPAGTAIVWTSDDSQNHDWKYVLLVNRGTADLNVGVDFEQLGLTPDSSCSVTELWDAKPMGQVYHRLTATLRPHASLFVRVSDCKYQPHPPPHPPPAPEPPTAPIFCAAGNLSACESPLQSPTARVATCSADFEHVQRAALSAAAASSMGVAEEAVHIEALYVDVQGNQHSDLHVVGVVYTDDDGPRELLATSQPVLVPAKSPRSFVRLPFAKTVAVTGAAVWIGEQAGAPPGVKTVPGGPNSLSCYGMPESAQNEPLRYIPWPFASGPRHSFGPPSNVTISANSLSIFAVTAVSSSNGPHRIISVKSDDPDATIDLDATAWEFEADPLNVGVSERWWDPDVKMKLERTIRTPGAWQAQGVGNETALMTHQFMGVGWYRKNITIGHTNTAMPASVWLWIGGAPGGVMRSAHVWANGIYIGQHVGYIEPLEMDLTRALGSSDSVLLTVAVDSRWNRTIDPLWGSGSLWNKGGNSNSWDQGGGGDGFSFGGYGGIIGHARLVLRQRVWIEDSVHVQCQPESDFVTATDLQIAADWACKVQFALVGEVKVDDTVDVAVCSWNEPLDPCARVTGNAAPSSGRSEISVVIKNARLWFPGTPEWNGVSDRKSLYFANLTVVNGKTVLSVASRRFGVKLVNTDGPRISFNGESLFLSGYGDDGNVYGASVAPPLDKSFYLSQLTSMQHLGYNFIRFHTHSMPEEFFEAADELGFMCDPEFAMNYGYPTAWGSPITPAVKHVFNRSFASVVQRLAHHPSIFGWVLSNEIEWPSACLPPAATPAQHSPAACNATCGAPCSPPQFVELYRYAKMFDPTRPCWWSDGVSGMSPGLSCRNGADSADKYCFADVMVAQSGWGHTNNPDEERGSGLDPTWSEMPVPYILHEAYDGRTFPRLLTNLESYKVGGMFKADVWLNSSIDKMRQLFAISFLEENDLWSFASELEYTMRLKNFVESYRLDNSVSGFEWWLGFDWLGSSNGIIGGHEEAWRPKPGINNETMQTVHAPVVLLARDHVTLQSIGRYPFQTVTAELLLSNWTFGGFPSWNSRAWVEWTVQIETSDGDSKLPTYANGSSPVTAHMVPQGQTQVVANVSFQVPVVAKASKVALHAYLKIGDSITASNVWRIPTFPHPVAPRPCTVPVFADTHLVNATRTICSNAQEVSTTQPFVAPSKSFVMVTDNLRSDVAAAVQHTGGVALIPKNVPEGNFPVCAVSPIGTVPSFTHSSGQTWWFVAGQVGTVVYNTTLTESLGVASGQHFMDMGLTSVVEGAQGFTLDDVEDTVVHIRSIPSNIVAASTVTEIHNNALVWERPFAAADYGVTGHNSSSGPGRLIVSGLNIFDAKQPGQLRGGEPQTEFVFRSLLEYAMHQTNASGSTRFSKPEQTITRDRPQQRAPPPSSLCSKLESFCEADSLFACSAVAHQVSQSICNGDFACIQPSSLLNSTINFSQPGKSLHSIRVFVAPNDARNRNSQIRGLLYASRNLNGPKTLIANGSSVSPFLNWTFNGLDPVGAATWVELPMPSIQLPPPGYSSETVFWTGMVASKDCACFGKTKGSASPALGPFAPDAYVKMVNGAPNGPWTPGLGSISSFVTVK